MVEGSGMGGGGCVVALFVMVRVESELSGISTEKANSTVDPSTTVPVLQSILVAVSLQLPKEPVCTVPTNLAPIVLFSPKWKSVHSVPDRFFTLNFSLFMSFVGGTKLFCIEKVF